MTRPSARIVPDYAEAQLRGPSRWLSRIAIACGLLPLTVGTAAFLLYVLTRSLSFPVLGVYTIVAGIPVVLIGLILLVIYAGLQRGAGLVAPRRRLLVPAILLLVNFPAAVIYAMAGCYLLFTVNIIVVNNSTQPLDEVIMQLDTQVGLGQVNLGRVPAGGSVSYQKGIRNGETSLGVNVRISQSGASLPAPNLDSLPGPRSGTIRVIVNDQRSVSVRKSSW